MFHLYKLHHGDRVEEVKAAKSVQPGGGAGDVGDGQRGRVACKYCVSRKTPRVRAFRKKCGRAQMGPYSLWCHLVKPMKDVLFDFQIFHNGLQHEVRPLSCRSRVCGRRHIPQDLLDEFFPCLKMQHPSIVTHICLSCCLYL